MTDRRDLEEAMAAQERLRGVVPDSVIEATIGALRTQIDALTAQPHHSRQRRLVTVMFADVSGFTAMSSAMDAEDVGDTFEVLWGKIDRAITHNNGSIDKHIGDAVMAVWGGEVAREDDPEQAIRAALDVQRAVAEFNSEHGEEGMALSLRIGINTGPVLMGDVATTNEFTAIGDTVNVASRLESTAPAGGVLIGHGTYRHVRGIFTVAEQPPLQVKGKDELLMTYLIEGVRPRPFRLETRGVDGVETRMIGRDDDLAALKAEMHRVIDSGGLRLVTVVGEAGIGKSRLLYEFEDWLRIQPNDVRLFQGRADQQRELVPYALARDVLFSRFEISENDPVAVATEKLVGGFAAYLGAGTTERAHLAAHLVGFDMRESPYLSAILDDPRQLRDRAFSAVADLIRAMTVAVPGVMLLEDIHWADRASLDLIEHVVTACRSVPLAIVALARPVLFEKRPEWGVGIPSATRLDLAPLDSAVTGLLVAEVLKMVPHLPDVVRDTIVANADGNPFYVEELVKTLIEAGAIRKNETSWEVESGRLAELRVPPTLTGVLQARLDRLDADERGTLQRASVVGRVFWDAAVVEESDDGGGASRGKQVKRNLQSLKFREFVFQNHDSAFSGANEFSFSHALLRDVTYETVLKRQRREYHAAVARWLEAQEEAEARAAMIAHHFELASMAPAAAEWYVRAADQARLRFANEDAISYYERALGFGELTRPAQLPVLDRLGEVLMLQARYDEALVANRDMRRAAEDLGDVLAQARALTGMAFAQGRQGANREALESAESAEDLLRSFPEERPVELADAILGAGWLSIKTGDVDAAKRRAEEAISLSRDAGDQRGIARGLNLLSFSETTLGRDRAAIEHLEEALAIDRLRGDLRNEGASLINLGEAARSGGDYRSATESYIAALAIQRELGDRDLEALSLSNLGGAYVGMGNFDEAIRNLDLGLQAFQETGASEYVGETHRFLAEAYLGRGETTLALDHVQLALARATEAASPEQVGHAWRVLGLVAAKTGALVSTTPGGEKTLSPEACFGAGVATFAEANLDRDRALCLADWARYERAIGSADAEPRLAAARDILVRLGLDGLVAGLDAAHEPRESAP